jgi:predicted MFS family arabinose efflux permease
MNAKRVEDTSSGEIKKRNSVKIKLILSSIILSLLAVGFNTFFTEATIEKLYIEINISEYQVFSKEILRKIENGLYFGKKLNSYVGMQEILLAERENIINKIAQNKSNNIIENKDISISVARLDGEIIYSDNQALIKSTLPESILDNYNDEKRNSKKASSNFTKYHEYYYIHHQIRDRDKKPVGLIVIGLTEKKIRAFLSEMIKDNSIGNITISIVSVIALVVMLSLIPMDKNNFSKKKISFIIFFIICSAQLLTAGIITSKFKDNFLEINKNNSEALNTIIQQNVQYLLNKGIRISKLVKMEVYLNRIIQDINEINDITLYDHNSYPIYRATKLGGTDFQRSNNAYMQWMEATKPLVNTDFNTKKELNSNNSFKGYISTNTSQSIIFKKVFDIAIGSFTALVISILFLVEMLILFFRYLERDILEGGDFVAEQSAHYSLMRPAVFLLLFGVDISISFIPLHMNEIYTPLIGLPKETIVGLPISVEFMFVGLAILISGVWLDRRGWHEPFICGLMLASSGFVYSGLAPDAIHFIISRAIVGLGYGLSLMASQGFVITYSDNNRKAQGLANLFAGIYAGSICGGATGGMIAEQLGYNATFLFGAMIIMIIIGYTFAFMKNSMKMPNYRMYSNKILTQKSKKSFENVFKFLTNRIVISLVFFSSLPAAIATVGFMNYFMPVYLNRLGISQSTIGQVLMIYGICLIYIGPYISKYVDITRDKKKYVFLGCVLGSAAFISFYFFDGIISAVISILMLGLSSSFVLASQSVYALKLKVTKKLGEGKAIGIFRSTSRIGQMLGPIVFSWMFAATNVNQGIMFFGIAYMLTAFVFILLTKKDYLNLVADET